MFERIEKPVRVAVYCLAALFASMAVQTAVVAYQGYVQVGAIVQANRQLQGQLQQLQQQAQQEIAKRDARIEELGG